MVPLRSKEAIKFFLGARIPVPHLFLTPAWATGDCGFPLAQRFVEQNGGCGGEIQAIHRAKHREGNGSNVVGGPQGGEPTSFAPQDNRGWSGEIRVAIGDCSSDPGGKWSCLETLLSSTLVEQFNSRRTDRDRPSIPGEGQCFVPELSSSQAC